MGIDGFAARHVESYSFNGYPFFGDGTAGYYRDTVPVGALCGMNLTDAPNGLF